MKVSSFHFCPNRRALLWVSRRRNTSRLANWSLTITSEIKKASSTWHWWPISFWSVWKWADILEQSSRPSLTLQVRTKSVTTEVNCEFPAGETSAFSCVHIRGKVGGPWTEDAKSFSLFGPAYVSHFQEAPKNLAWLEEEVNTTSVLPEEWNSLDPLPFIRCTTRDYVDLVHVHSLTIYPSLSVFSFFISLSLGRTEPLSDQEKWIGSLLLRHLQLLQFNAHEVSELRMDRPGCMDGAKTFFLGAGVYPTVLYRRK